MAQFGSALPWGGRGRGFKSRYSDQKKKPANEHFARLRAFFMSCAEKGIPSVLPIYDTYTTLVPDQQKNRARRNHRRARLTIHGSGSFIRVAVLCRRAGFHKTLAKTGTRRFQKARDFRSGVPDRGGASDQALSERRARPASRP